MSRIDTKHGVIAWFARNSVAANLLMWMLLIGGIFGAIGIQKQIFPTFDINIINVRVPYLGAAPQEVEEGVILQFYAVLRVVAIVLLKPLTRGCGQCSVLGENSNLHRYLQSLIECQPERWSNAGRANSFSKPV